ncbi:MAG: hypothetical protein ACLFQW_00445 [Spirochaetaceae bacterium]
MTDIYIYSDREEIRALFRGINRSTQYRIFFMPREELGSEAVREEGDAIKYLDLTGYNPKEVRYNIRLLSSDGGAWAVIDPQGIVEDPAELFHQGACDFLSPLQLEERIRAARIHRVVAYGEEHFKTKEIGETGIGLSSSSLEESGGEADWDEVCEGQVYSFYFLYIELLPGEEWRVKAGDKNRKKIQGKFEEFVRRRITPNNGRIWMWAEWGGIILFPYAGDNADPVILASRLILNRPLISIEEIGVDNLVDYRIALHVGKTQYNKRGYTGEIISDDINFIFHLGKKRVEKNSLYVTESVYPQVPRGMRSLFIRESDFENRGLHRMRRFIF